MRMIMSSTWGQLCDPWFKFPWARPTYDVLRCCCCTEHLLYHPETPQTPMSVTPYYDLDGSVARSLLSFLFGSRFLFLSFNLCPRVRELQHDARIVSSPINPYYLSHVFK